jgi:hypothetical protein
VGVNGVLGLAFLDRVHWSTSRACGEIETNRRPRAFNSSKY